MNKTSLFISLRYLFSKKSTQAISIILWVSIIAFCFTGASMFVVMSVFSGLKELNLENSNKLNSNFVILPSKGKTINNLNNVLNYLDKNKDISSYSRIIDEKVYIINNEKEQVAYIKGIEQKYSSVINTDSLTIYGNFPDFIYHNEIAISSDLSYRLDIAPNKEYYYTLYMPKKGKGIIKTEEEAFIKKDVFTTGILNENFSNTILCPIDLVENLLGSDSLVAYSIMIKTKDSVDETEFQNRLKLDLGTNYIIKNRLEQDQELIKMMNIEQLMIYFIFTLIIIISSFNLAGAIIIIIIDKSKQNQALISMGLNQHKIKQIYFNLGLFITFIGIFIGLLIGTLIIILQQKYSIIMVNEYLAFPVKIEFINFVLVFFSILLFGLFISWFSSRKLKY